MPVLNLGDCGNNGHEKAIACAKIMSVMFFPKDPEQEKNRQEFIACFLVPFIEGQLESGNLQDDFLISLQKIIRILSNAPSCDEVMHLSIGNSLGALYAGEILFGVYYFNKKLPEAEIGIKKAVFLLHKYGDYPGQIVKIKMGKRIRIPKKKLHKPPGCRTIEKHWNEYKQVAHFYAALKFFDENRNKRIINLDLLKPDNILNFLAISNQIREFGENYIPKQGVKKTLLTKNEVWSVGIDCPLQKVTLNLPRPKGWIKKALKEYKAPKKIA